MTPTLHPPQKFCRLAPWTLPAAASAVPPTGARSPTAYQRGRHLLTHLLTPQRRHLLRWAGVLIGTVRGTCATTCAGAGPRSDYAHELSGNAFTGGRHDEVATPERAKVQSWRRRAHGSPVPGPTRAERRTASMGATSLGVRHTGRQASASATSDADWHDALSDTLATAPPGVPSPEWVEAAIAAMRERRIFCLLPRAYYSIIERRMRRGKARPA